VCGVCTAPFTRHRLFVERGQERFCSRACANRGRALTPAKRFARLVDRRDPDQCWPWLGQVDEDGYGRFRSGGKGSAKVGAHRFAFELADGRPIPPGLEVRHACDNPPCCNPAHLALGGHYVNIRDKVRRSRQARGARHGSAKLTQAQMVEICRRYPAHERQTALAREFGVTQANISLIVRGESWRSVARQFPVPV
jgi:hypothetical protein